MAEFVIRVGCRSAQGLRSNNEDRFVADAEHQLFLVADGMGGQEYGERASGMAAEIIPRVVQDRLAANDDPHHAVKHALSQANPAVIQSPQTHAPGPPTGPTPPPALHPADPL